MKINKVIHGFKYVFYVNLIPNSMTANVRYFANDVETECKITDDFKYVILPDSMVVYITGIGNVPVKKLKFAKYQQAEIKDVNNIVEDKKTSYTEKLVNPYYQMMIKNAAIYCRTQSPLNPDTLNAFQISEVIAICTCKLKEDVISDIISVKL